MEYLWKFTTLNHQIKLNEFKKKISTMQSTFSDDDKIRSQ